MCYTGGGIIDFDKLRSLFTSKVVEGNVERYEFTWPGKRAARAAASTATTKTLRPCRAESVNFDTTENLYIEGDNLEVLKLLQTSYAGKVKMIYIDPPYNTGHDFVYRDRFSLTAEELAKKAGSLDEDGNLVDFTNDSSEARYHSNWCSMMYPRLKLARNLLRDDGVIFVSIDDSESLNVRRICNEIFGETNFIAQITIVSNPRGRDYGGVAKMHEYLFVYRKTEALQLSLIEDATNEFPYTDNRGGFELRELRNRNVKFNQGNRPNLYYPFYINSEKEDDNGLYEISLIPKSGWVELYPLPSQGVKVVWRWGKTRAEANLNSEIKAKRMKNGGFMIVEKYRESRKMVRSVWWDKETNTERGTLEVKCLFNNTKVFDYPKPVAMVCRMIEMATLNEEDEESLNSVVLDFFSGSATTAHAVLQRNAEDGGNRKFIMVQYPEPCAKDSEAAKAGYKNICEIGKERIRRAGKKIAEENATNAPNLDVGFRVLKLASSSLNDTSATVSETTQEFKNFDRIKSDRSPEDLLFQMLLETRIPLSETIATAKVGGNTVFFVGVSAPDELSGAPLVACLDPKARMTTEFFMEVAKLKPGIAFFRDDAFADDSARTNLQQAFDQFSPTTSIKVI